MSMLNLVTYCHVV